MVNTFEAGFALSCVPTLGVARPSDRGDDEVSKAAAVGSNADDETPF
jgi:hypothetical protein